MADRDLALSRLLDIKDNDTKESQCQLCHSIMDPEIHLLRNSSTKTEGSGKPYIHVSRSAVNQVEFDEMHAYTDEKESLKQICGKSFKKTFTCSQDRLKVYLYTWFPFLNTILTYKLKNIVGDITAGISVGVMHVPQSMGFALLAGLKPVYGLYSSFFPNIIYFFFGTSHHASVGTMAVISLMIRTVVEADIEGFTASDENSTNKTKNLTGENLTLTTPNPDDASEAERVAIATSLTLLIGLFQLGMGLFNLAGIIIRYMPTSFLGGFTTGAAFHIVTSQLKFLLGLKLPFHNGAFMLIKTYISVFENIVKTNLADLIIGLICMFILILIKEFINVKFKSKLKVPIPGELSVVVLGTLISYFVNLSEKYNVNIIGEIPRGFPQPEIPSLSKMNNHIFDAFLTALVSFVISISMATLYMLKYDYKVNNNQEMFAYGAINSVSSFFHCFAGAVAPPRCHVHDSTGGKTQVASLVAGLILLIVILGIGPYFATLPKSVLASIIIVALFPLLKQFKDLKMLWRVNKWDSVIWLITWLAVVVIDVVLGLIVGIGFSLFTIILQSQFSKATKLQRANSLDLYITPKHKNYSEKDGIRIFRYDGMLYYANAEFLKTSLTEVLPDFEDCKEHKEMNEELTENVKTQSLDKSNTAKCTLTTGDVILESNTKEKLRNAENQQNLISSKCSKWIILDCSVISYIDLVGLNTMKQIKKMLQTNEIDLILVSCNRNMYEKLVASGYLNEENITSVYPTIQDALVYVNQQKKLNHSIDMAITDTV